MAFQMQYTDEKTGAIYPASYWIPVSLNLNKQTKVGMVNFFGFVDAAARLQEKQKIANKTYRIMPDSYDLYFCPNAQNPEGQNPYSAAYTLALATLEGVPPEGEPDNRSSFFAEATNV